jgi:hypothetical protein
MKTRLYLILIFTALFFSGFSAEPFRVKGLCIGAPAKEDIGEFIRLIENELVPAGVNTLILRVDYGYRF